MFQVVVHVVTNPRNPGTESPFCFINMHHSFLDTERCDVSVVFGVSECLVDVIELHTLGLIVALDCLQTGDITKKRWSGEATKYQNGVTATQTCRRKITALFVNRAHGGQEGAGLRNLTTTATGTCITRRLGQGRHHGASENGNEQECCSDHGQAPELIEARFSVHRVLTRVDGESFRLTGVSML